MTETNDYEKAKSECWEKVPLIISPKNAFEFGFHSAWHHPKANAQPANGLVNERLQVAAMAMQGLLSNINGFQLGNKDVPKSPENVAMAAVLYADALLTELNKPTNEKENQ